MAFPGAGAHVYRNDAGEPLGWDYPPDPADLYCHDCGACHSGECCDLGYRDEYDPEVDATDDDLETVEQGADLETARAAFARNLRRVGIPEQYVERCVEVASAALARAALGDAMRWAPEVDR